MSKKEAARHAWETVNAETHGGKNPATDPASLETTLRRARVAISVAKLPLTDRRLSVPHRRGRRPKSASATNIMDFTERSHPP